MKKPPPAAELSIGLSASVRQRRALKAKPPPARKAGLGGFDMLKLLNQLADDDAAGIVKVGGAGELTLAPPSPPAGPEEGGGSDEEEY